jgi:hypothetical protein
MGARERCMHLLSSLVGLYLCSLSMGSKTSAGCIMSASVSHASWTCKQVLSLIAFPLFAPHRLGHKSSCSWDLGSVWP